MNVVRTKVKNYVLIRYEDLLNNYDNTLDQIKNEFNLVKTHEEYEKIVNHTNGSGLFTGERTIDFSRDIINDIWSRLDVAQEKLLGYDYYNELHVNAPTVEPQVLKKVEVEQAVKNVVHPIPSKCLEGMARPKSDAIVKRNYLSVAMFIDNQIKKEVKRVSDNVKLNITSVIPRFTSMFASVISPKITTKSVTATPIKPKKNVLFLDLRRCLQR
jgi:hypothetical protein